MSTLRNIISRPSTVIAVVAFLLISFSDVRCESAMQNVLSNCYIRDYSNIRCTGDFNVSNILFEQRQLVDPNAGSWSQRSFSGLEIIDSDIEGIDENFLQFHGFKFETILIENAPKLKSISPKALTELKDHLTDFRAVNTSLPPYNDFGNGPHKMENPFDDFKQLREVYIGPQSRCPSDETLLLPCTCKFGELARSVPSELYGLSYGISNTFGTTTQITCDNEALSGDQLREIFRNVSLSDHEPKHFDVLTFQGATNLTDIPSDVFSNVSITSIWMDNADNLKSIHPQAFVSETSDDSARSIQVLVVHVANFTAANPLEVRDLFQAFSSLTNIRVLRLSECGIPHIPPHAFAPESPQKQLNNLRYLSLSFDRRHHDRGIKSVGSYAFSGAPKLVKLGIEKNFIEEFDSFAFAFNETSKDPLTVYIGGNPFKDSYGLKANAFSGSQRPVHIIFNVNSFEASDTANDPSLDFMPENVFRPFIEENSENYFEVDYFNVDVWCDCNSKWMFDDMGQLKQNVQNGLRIKRIADNVVASDPLSVQCKANSSFDCLPKCVSFPAAELVHCGGNTEFDVKSTFLRLSQSSGAKKLKKLLLSSTEIHELPADSFGSFQFDSVDLAGEELRVTNISSYNSIKLNSSFAQRHCHSLSLIHPDAFGASAATVKSFSAINTNLTYYPEFASFPNLEVIKLDDNHMYHLNSSNFDFSKSTEHPEEINVFVGNRGTIDPKAFSKLNDKTAVKLNVGERTECSTLGCLFNCKPITLSIDEETVKTFLEANPKNIIQTNCYFECSCNIKWLYEKWNDTESRVGIWIQEYFGNKFYCVPNGVSLKTDDNFFGIDVSKFNHGDYFKKNC